MLVLFRGNNDRPNSVIQKSVFVKVVVWKRLSEKKVFLGVLRIQLFGFSGV